MLTLSRIGDNTHARTHAQRGGASVSNERATEEEGSLNRLVEKVHSRITNQNSAGKGQTPLICHECGFDLHAPQTLIQVWNSKSDPQMQSTNSSTDTMLLEIKMEAITGFYWFLMVL